MSNRNPALLNQIQWRAAFSGESGFFLAIVLIVHALLILMIVRSATPTGEVTPPMMGLLLASSSSGTQDGNTSDQPSEKLLPAENSHSPPLRTQNSSPPGHQVTIPSQVPSVSQVASEVSADTSSSPATSNAASASATNSSAASPASAGASTGSGGNSLTPPNSDAGHLNNPKPVYPAASRRMGEEGGVLLSVYILADGTVGSISLKQSSGFKRLDEAALNAVRKWRYVPARQNGKTIPYWYTQPVIFSLND